MHSIKHYTNSDQILKYLQANPVWVSAFTNGEGSFTASAIIDTRAQWGLFPQCEFNITQLMDDLLLLEALHAFFGPPPKGVTAGGRPTLGPCLFGKFPT